MHAFLKRAVGIYSDDQPANDALDALIDEDQIARSRQAEIDQLLSEFDDDPVEASSDDEQDHLQPAPAICAAPSATPDKRAALSERNEMIRNARAEKKRRYTRNRVRLHRARSSVTSYATLVAKLRKATANPRGDKLLEQLRGKEQALAMFCYVASVVRAKSGPISAADLAANYERVTGDKITRLQVDRNRKRIVRLQAQGGPWHSL